MVICLSCNDIEVTVGGLEKERTDGTETDWLLNWQDTNTEHNYSSCMR